MSESDIVSVETSSGSRRSLGRTPTCLVALLQRIQSVGLDLCGWVAPLQRDQSRGVTMDAYLDETISTTQIVASSNV
jgi:hypothetical protein